MWLPSSKDRSTCTRPPSAAQGVVDPEFICKVGGGAHGYHEDCIDSPREGARASNPIDKGQRPSPPRSRARRNRGVLNLSRRDDPLGRDPERSHQGRRVIPCSVPSRYRRLAGSRRLRASSAGTLGLVTSELEVDA